MGAWTAVNAAVAGSVAEVADSRDEHRRRRRRRRRRRPRRRACEPPGWANAVTPACEADLDRVGEREERVGGARRAAGARLARHTRGPCSTAPRAASTRDVWPEPMPDEPAVADQHDRVRGDAADEPPGEVEVEPLGVGRGAAGGDASRSPGRRATVSGRGDEDGAAGRPERAERVGRRGARRSSRASAGSTTSAQVRLRGEDLERAVVERRAPRRPRGRSRRAPRPPPRPPAGSAPRPHRTPRPGRRPARPPTPRGASARSAAPHGFVCLTMTHGRAAQRAPERRRPPTASSTLL